MSGSYSDNLEFNSEQLLAQIQILEGIRDMITNSKTKYEDYVANQLQPNWTTENGIKTVDELKNFAETDIQSFINYLNDRIEDLNVAHQKTISINNA